MSQGWLKLMSIELVMSSDYLILSHPLLLPPSIFPSISILYNESVHCIRWIKYWSFGFSISPSNEYSGLISFRMDWLDLLAVQGPLKTLLRNHSSKSSVLWCSVSHVCTWLLDKPQLWLDRLLLPNWYLCFLNICCSDLGAPKNKVSHCFHILPWSHGTRCCDLSFLNIEL